jgi:hypothetical protein
VESRKEELQAALLHLSDEELAEYMKLTPEE